MPYGRRRALAWLLAGTAAGSAAIAAAAPAALADASTTGKVLGCTYNASLDSSAQTFTATVSGCSSSLDPTGELDGTYQTDHGSTIVSLTTVQLTILGQEEDLTPNFTLTLPVDLNATADQVAQLQKLVTQFESELVPYAADFATTQLESGIPSGLKSFDDLTDALNTRCARGTSGTDPFCLPYAPDACGQPPGCPLISPALPNEGVVADSGDDADSNDADQSQLCPVFNASQKKAVFVCVPSFVDGDLNTHGKPLVIIGGGALLMTPSPTTGRSSVISSRAIVGLGGAIVGANLTLKAPTIELAGGFADGLLGLHLSGTHVSVGSVDGKKLLDGISWPIKDWHAEITRAIDKQITVPEAITGPNVQVAATRTFDLAHGSTIDSSGRGSHGGLFGTGAHSTAESVYYGGSHGGLGAPSFFYLDGDFLGFFTSRQGRAPTFDNPFDPSLPGDGGGALPGDGAGQPGGGAVHIDAHGAAATLDGKIDVTGADTGNPNGNGDHGGAGAGGSIFLSAKSLTGNGDVDADGGSNCATCVNGFGGGGGGGRIAVLTTRLRSWHGHLHAYGGRDFSYPGPPPASDPTRPFLGTGGAGTVFTQAVTFSKSGRATGSKTATFPAGTLVIDAGRGPASFPAPDGTPLPAAWNSAKRHLVIKGDARAYGSKLDYKQIDISGGAVLTTGIDGSSKPIPTALTIKTRQLGVDRTAQISMTGRGYPGGLAASPAGAGATAHGQTPSTGGHGGSHGGAGGAVTDGSGRSGSTYDSRRRPALPGGGGAGVSGDDDGSAGGGVLSISADTLVLAGAISADGERTSGPTKTDLIPHEFGGGAGAGGSLVVTVKTLKGAGRLSANGGDACVASRPPLLAGVAGCGLPSGGPGGGGGGLVAIHAGNACKWRGSALASGGVDLQAELQDKPHAPALRGRAGSVSFPRSAHCS